MADGTGTAPAPASGGGMDPKLAGAISYLWITAIIFLLIEPYNKDKFVRFHSFQSLFLGIASIIIHTVLMIIPIIGWLLLPFASLGILILAIMGGVKAYQGQQWQMPIIGKIAAEQANK